MSMFFTGASANTFKYNGALSGIPATCAVGDLAFVTDATAGQQIYECSTTNVWTQQLNGGGGPPSGAASGDLGSNYPSPTVKALHWTQKALVFAGSPYTVLATDTEVNCDATGGNIVVNLPASSGGGKNYFFIKTDNSVNTVTVTRAGADTIEGSATVVLASQYDSLLLVDAASGSWLKISPKTPGVNGNLMFNNNGIPGAVTNSTVDNGTDASVNNKNQIVLSQAVTVGGAAQSIHGIDVTTNYTGSASNSTEAAGYFTLKHQASAGTFPHNFATVARLQDFATGGTETLAAAAYADWTTDSTFNGDITALDGFHFDGGILAAAGAHSITNASAIYLGNPTFSGANITLTQLNGARIKVPAATTARITSFAGVNCGDCTKSNVYASGVFCGGTTYFQSPVDITANTDANATAPMTDTNKTLFTITGTSNLAGGTGKAMDILEQSNNASGTTVTSIIAGNFTASLGNTGTNTDSVAVAAKVNSSGVITNPTAIRIISPTAGGTYTNLRGLEIQAQAGVGTQTNSPRAIDQQGASDFNTFAGTSFLNGNRSFVNADFTTSGSGTALETITNATGPAGSSLGFVLPANIAQNVPFNCTLIYHQNTAAVAVAFGVKNSVAPTQLNATAQMSTSATASTMGNLVALASTTATTIVSATPSAITTNWNVYLSGFIENPSGAANTVTFLVSTATAGDTVTVKRGSFCTLGV